MEREGFMRKAIAGLITVGYEQYEISSRLSHKESGH